MWRCTAIALLACSGTTLLAPAAVLAQQDQPETKRKVVNRIPPSYPDLARSLDLKGSVKVDVLVAPNGKVKSLEVKGGHPVLAHAAEEAIRKWKWEPGTHETWELLEIRFDPH